jgi:hypothetical protein
MERESTANKPAQHRINSEQASNKPAQTKITDIEWRPHERRHDDAATSGIARQQQIYKKNRCVRTW